MQESLLKIAQHEYSYNGDLIDPGKQYYFGMAILKKKIPAFDECNYRFESSLPNRCLNREFLNFKFFFNVFFSLINCSESFES